MPVEGHEFPARGLKHVARRAARFVHDGMGIHAQQDPTGDWSWMVQDGLGSVRSVVDESFAVLHSQHYAPYGEPFGESGTSQTDFGFTGEPTDGNGLVHLRARYLNPSLGVFPSLDPLEFPNRYGYVGGNPVIRIDPSGLTQESCGMPPPVSDFLRAEPCPSLGSHPFIQSTNDLNWVERYRFCRGGNKNNDLEEIMDRLEDVFDFEIPQRRRWVPTPIPNPYIILWGRREIPTPWTWDELAGIARGARLIRAALERIDPSLDSPRLLKDAFAGTKIRRHAGGFDPFQPVASLAFSNPRTPAVVPPPGLPLSDGRTVFIRAYGNVPSSSVCPNDGDCHDRTFIHELGHVLDFRLGAIYDRLTLQNSHVPSTSLLSFLLTVDPENFGGYIGGGTCSNLYGSEWGICIASRGAITHTDISLWAALDLLSSGYQPGSGYIPPGTYTTSYGSTDHFEDFAESWTEVILDWSEHVHGNGINYIPRVDNERQNFILMHMVSWLETAR